MFLTSCGNYVTSVVRLWFGTFVKILDKFFGILKRMLRKKAFALSQLIVFL